MNMLSFKPYYQEYINILDIMYDESVCVLSLICDNCKPNSVYLVG